MHLLYAHCPHCEFPVVVNGVEAALPRRCRQCRGEYTPGAPLLEAHSAVARRAAAIQHQRAGLRLQLRQRRRIPR